MPRKTGTIETFMQRNPKVRTRMTSRSGQGRRAVTHWEVLAEWRSFPCCA
jgi:23S rRNA-/tRNA-specific pseudouridylate synthase